MNRSNITLDGGGHTIQGVTPEQISQTTNHGGIGLSRVQNVTVKGFSIKDCGFGISMLESSNIIVSGNNISGTWATFPDAYLSAGVEIRGGSDNLVTGNHFENNMVSIRIWQNSKQNVIVGNTISGSTEAGIKLSESSGNTFYHNNFDNKQNVYDSSLHPYSSASLSINDWDNGKEGNFWSDYNGTDADGDGIGDTPHKLYFLNQDNYPLMKPWEPTPIDNTPPIVSIFSPENTKYTVNSLPLNFSTNEPVSWLGYSLDGQENVTITGNTTLNELPNGSHNLTVYATDQSGNTGASEIVYFSVNKETEPSPTTWLIAATLIVAVFGAGLLVYLGKRRNKSKIS